MKKKILIVEDDSDVLKGLCWILTKEGFDAVGAGDGDEGLRQAIGDPPDLIITDIYLPALDGVEMIKLLRKQPAFAAVPIVVLSAFPNDITRAVAAGANSAIPKPVDRDVLIRIVRNLLP
ncbi:MAG: response regulator [Blastocatellia bacterium]